jgi:hypothetical protein
MLTFRFLFRSLLLRLCLLNQWNSWYMMIAQAALLPSWLPELSLTLGSRHPWPYFIRGNFIECGCPLVITEAPLLLGALASGSLQGLMMLWLSLAVHSNQLADCLHKGTLWFYLLLYYRLGKLERSLLRLILGFLGEILGEHGSSNGLLLAEAVLNIQVARFIVHYEF